MTVLSLVFYQRSHAIDLALFFHVAGALCTIASLVAGFCVLLLAWAMRDNRPELSRLGFRTLLFAGIPSFIVMRGAAQWVLSKEYPGSYEPHWVSIAFPFTDIGTLLLIIATILAWLGARRQRNGGGFGLTAAATVLTGAVLVMLTVVIWAMTTKPT